MGFGRMSIQAPEVVLSRNVRDNIGEDGGEQFFNEAAASSSFIPSFLRKPMLKLSGALLIILSALGAIALATWTISDPSLTFANGSEAENWLGFWGASFADFTMQFLGFGAVVLLVPPLIWGVFKYFGHTINSLSHRMGWYVASLVCSTAALACIGIPTGWPLQVGLGGVVGDAVLSIPRAFTGSYPGGIFAVLLFLVFSLPSIWLLLRACNLENGLSGVSGLSNQVAEDDLAPSRETGLLLEDELDEGFQLQQRENQGWDWGAIIAMPIGLVMHLSYSISAAARKRKQARNEVAQIHGDMVVSSNDGELLNNPRSRISPTMDSHPEADIDTGNQHGAELQSRSDIGPAAHQIEPNATHYQDVDFVGQLDVEESNPTQGVLHRERLSPVSIDGGGDEDHPVPHTDSAHPSESSTRPVKRAKVKQAGSSFMLPELELLSEQKSIVQDPSLSNDALEENARLLEGVLEDFGVKGQILKVRPGPVVTLYELEPAPGVKSSRVIGLAEDIARSMSAIAARVAVVPGRNAIGIELPNKRRETVYLREQLSSPEFSKTKAKLPMCLGKTIGGEPVIADMAKMPHLLVAGTTGSGKSVAINTMILSLLYRLSPEQCKLIMIDPKMLELSIYDGIPHLLTPVVVDPKKAVVALKWTVREMEDRYKKMSKVGVRNIDGFNTRVAEAAAKGEVITRTVQTGFDRDTGEAIYEHEELDLEAMPYIVVIIDEMADLMMVAGKDIEGTVQRLAQMARAAGIHVIMATQRPSTDVITGTIKANFPTRISFQVTSKIDSRVMLGESGAEQLLGMGDMLYMAGGGRITRVHGPFVDDHEVEDVVNHLKTQGVPQYLEAVTEEDEEESGSDGGTGTGSGGNLSNSADPYDQAVAIVLRDRKASTSYIQRRLSVGYNKAASLIERMEQEGLISPANHAGKREILVPAEDETI